ncbi:MAG: hypothetical protein V8R55_11870 [Dysosmobacter sp.]
MYQELSSRWPEFFSEQEQTHPTDQLLHIAEVLDGISEINEYNPFSPLYGPGCDRRGERDHGDLLRPAPDAKTFADRQALKLENAKAKGREQVQKVREQYTTRLAELREQNRQRVRERHRQGAGGPRAADGCSERPLCGRGRSGPGTPGGP